MGNNFNSLKIGSTQFDFRPLGICDTNANTPIKIVNSTDFGIFVGAKIIVAFSNINTASNPQLNVNNTGAYPILYNGSPLPQSQYWYANSIVEFIFNGSSWNVIGTINDNNDDVKVSQNLTTDNKELPLLLKYTSDANDEINSVKYASDITYQPATSTLNVGCVNSIMSTTGREWIDVNGESIKPFVLDYTYSVSDNQNSTNYISGDWNLGVKFNMGRDTSSRAESEISIFANKKNNSTEQVEKISGISISTGYEDLSNINNCSDEHVKIYSSGEVNISGDKNITLGVSEYSAIGTSMTSNDYNIKLNGKINKLYLPTSSNSSNYGYGSSGQVLKSNGSTVYWSNDAVEQKSISDEYKNKFYPMLFKYNDNTNNVTGNVNFSGDIEVNPHKKYLSGITTISPYVDDSSEGCTRNDIVYSNGNSAINIHGSIIETGLKTHIGTGTAASKKDYISIAQIHIVNETTPGYCNMAIMFQIAARDESYQNRVHVKFTYPTVSNAYPSEASVLYELPWNHEIFLMKESNNLWNLIVHQTSAYDNIDLIRVSIPAYLKNTIKVTIPNNKYFTPDQWINMATSHTKISASYIHQS